jgi:hypothetical protein
LLGQVIRFYQADTSVALFAANDRGVAAGGKQLQDRRLFRIDRRNGRRLDGGLLRIFPVVVTE